MKAETFEVKKQVTDLRVQEQDLRNSVDALGEPSPTVTPEDVQMMYAGKLVDRMLREKVAFGLMMKGYVKAYKAVDPDIKEKLTAIKEEFDEKFDEAKKNVNKICKKHPLAEKLCQIKGLTPYNLAIVMSHIKDPARFDTPGQMGVYAGVGLKHGLKVCKANLNKIRQIDMEQYSGPPEEYKEFGFNTRLSGRLFVLGDCLIRARGYFHRTYQNMRERMEAKAVNEGRTFVATVEDQERSKGKMVAGRQYKTGRKNQSLEMWAHRNASARIQRILLDIIYREWRTLRGLKTRDPYPIEYLGHTGFITLEDVLAYDGKK